MTPRRLSTLLLGPLVGIALAIVAATPAGAVTIEQKAAVRSNWTQPNSASYNAWNNARLNQAAWAAYAFDWSTDFCSTSPDQPLGFDFRMPCWHHDFGYRNYSDLGLFKERRKTVDDRFLADMRALCERELPWHRLSCGSWARTFYGGVRGFGWATED